VAAKPAEFVAFSIALGGLDRPNQNESPIARREF
jgi:hypothetical protein